MNAKAISAAMSFYALPPDPVNKRRNIPDPVIIKNSLALPPDPVIKKRIPKVAKKVTPAEVVLAKGA